MTEASTTRGRVRTERSVKRVRALVAGRTVFDTTNALLVWEVPYYPAYYVPETDVRAELRPTGETRRSPSRGEARLLDVHVGDETRPGAAWCYPDSPITELLGHVRFDWPAMDEWLEEDEPVYTHPRDPHTRVDILGSSRHVEVRIDGVVVADSRSPRILFETGLPPRYYLPMTDVRMELLQPTDTVTHCPYKGAASYWSVVIDGERYDDLAWCYRTPLPESQKVAGFVCFYNEKVDLVVDGVPQDRPHTHFS